MRHFDEIFEIAADNYGLITAAEATKIGVAKAELKRWVDNGRLEKRGRGVYKLTQYIPTEFDRYAEAVALVGSDSFLIGDAVLAMHGLALANPSTLTIGTPKRVRRNLPKWIKPVTAKNKQIASYEGIPSQTVAEAILECKNRVLPERLLDASKEAFLKGLVTKADYTRLKKELK